ncbi:Crp/Fnr family transcriptional regulator [Ferrimonas sp. YFM]|uniref:Crp/Fnr family transcriptional regulator n=1 Tax=Ferrimonas sp. YFM TaxID=3028878 RepID=UPI002572BF77|nr:Crp/Fnr family transcriptional regulator [Ferrimonas sp. YFM]BDY04711.1 Crp/Fnr family transcriptional regulator [Ferrimonas sp. YFM]
MTPEVCATLELALGQLGLTAHEVNQLAQAGKLRRLRPGETLSEQGRVPGQFHLLVEGLCHGVYHTESGRHYSKEFYWEGDWVIGYESLLDGIPLPFEFQAITDSTLMALPLDQLSQWRNQRHLAYLTLLETQLLFKERKERLLLLSTPEQRYRHFCEHYPQLLQRLADYQIAAYLGITPISLSRIKSRLNKG